MKSYGTWCNAEKIIKEVKIESRLGCSNHALVKFMIVRNMKLAKTRIMMLKLRRVNF